jgi:hypothetical protein
VLFCHHWLELFHWKRHFDTWPHRTPKTTIFKRQSLFSWPWIWYGSPWDCTRWVAWDCYQLRRQTGRIASYGKKWWKPHISHPMTWLYRTFNEKLLVLLFIRRIVATTSCSLTFTSLTFSKSDKVTSKTGKEMKLDHPDDHVMQLLCLEFLHAT